MAQGLTNAGFEVNQELVDFYRRPLRGAHRRGLHRQQLRHQRAPVSEYSQELLDNAKAFSDVALVVISRLGGDPGKHYLELQQVEIDMLNMVKENFGTVVVLINSANTMELGFLEEDDVDAALWLGCLGSTGCNALGQVLSGGVNPPAAPPAPLPTL